MTPQAQLKAIEDIQKSKGWDLLSSIMKEEALLAAMAIAENPKMSLDEINFRRGAIWAAKQLIELPSRVTLKLQNELALSRKDDNTNAPTP